MNTPFQWGVAVTSFLAALIILLLLFGDFRGKAVDRLKGVIRDTQADSGQDQKNRWKQTLQRMFTLLQKVRVSLGMAEGEALRERFLAAGIRSRTPVEIYFAVRMLGPIAAFLVGSFIPVNPFLCSVILACATYMAPDFWLNRAKKKRRENIRLGMPDTIDLLVICVDAGLGLDQAMMRAGMELSASHPEINEEFLQINREQRAGKLRIEAWQSMAARTELPDIEAFVSMLIQTERFGTPIARALSGFADNLRQKRRQRAEELAAKTTVKMLFPLVLFIFPSMFIVLLGPAVISVMHELAAMHR